MILVWWTYPLIMLSVFVPMALVYWYEDRKERPLPCLGVVSEAVYCADFAGHVGPCGVWYVFMVSEGTVYGDE